MGNSTKVGSFTVPSGTGNQSVTGCGFKPLVVLFWGDRLSADGTTSTPAAFTPWAGVAVSSTARTVITESDNFAGTADTAADATKCVKHITGATTSFAADLVTMDADGFTVNFTTANATAYVVNYLALGGAVVTAASIVSFTSSTGFGNVSYNGAGFRPDAVVFLGANNSTQDSFSLGVATSANARGCLAFSFNGTTNGIYQRTARCYAGLNGNAVHSEADFVSLDNDGFTLNWTVAPAATHTIYALCLRGGSYTVGAVTQKTSSGSQAYTGVGFAAQALLTFAYGFAASSSVQSTFGLRCMVGATSASTERAVVYYGSGVNAVGELDRAAVYAIRADDATPTLSAKADLTSFDVDGFTYNYSTADATARELVFLALGSGSALGGGSGLRPRVFAPGHGR